jgi:hypothetical protein
MPPLVTVYPCIAIDDYKYALETKIFMFILDKDARGK